MIHSDLLLGQISKARENARRAHGNASVPTEKCKAGLNVSMTNQLAKLYLWASALAALAEKERAIISTRRQAALQAAKGRGVKLGSPKLKEARKLAMKATEAAADRQAASVVPIIREVMRAGATTLREIADALNARGVLTSRGGMRYATSVKNVLARV